MLGSLDTDNPVLLLCVPLQSTFGQIREAQ